MSKLVILFACVAVFRTANAALQCYACGADTCTKDMATWQKVSNCGNTASPNLGGACLKQVYTDNLTQKDVTVRRCVIGDRQGDKIIFTCKNDTGITKVCQTCTDDFCNSASAINFSFVALASVLVAYLMPRFM